MKLTTLLSKLEEIGVTVATRCQFSSGLETITLASKAAFPFPDGHEHWHVLAIREGQDTIAKEEVEAIQRHLWKASVDLFAEDDPTNVKALKKAQGSPTTNRPLSRSPA